jgi:hypothetical protein
MDMQTMDETMLELPLHELRVRPARLSADRAAILELRREIDLAAAMAADPLFLHHEKKETTTASFSSSICTDR